MYEKRGNEPVRTGELLNHIDSHMFNLNKIFARLKQTICSTLNKYWLNSKKIFAQLEQKIT